MVEADVFSQQLSSEIRRLFCLRTEKVPRKGITCRTNSVKLEIDFPARTFVVIPVGRLDPPSGVTRGIDPDFQKFDRALKTQVRPVLVSLQRLPFRDFTAEEFLGRTLTIGAGGCVSVCQGSSLTLSQMADACVYVGGGVDVDSKASGSILFRNVKIEPGEKGRSLNSRPTWP